MEKIRITKETKYQVLLPNILYEVIETPHESCGEKYYYNKTFKVNNEDKETALRQLKTEFERETKNKDVYGEITEEMINLILKDDRICHDFCDDEHFSEVGVTHKLSNGYTAWISFIDK